MPGSSSWMSYAPQGVKGLDDDLFICSVFNDTNSSGYIMFYDFITADRWHKLKVFVVGKFKKPRCFKNAMHLPIVYDSEGKFQKVRTFLGQQGYSLVGQMQGKSPSSVLVCGNMLTKYVPANVHLSINLCSMV
jgi:hypothetical protein